jgi:tRNA G18 (ribose-2'-O)-methylase SpoU
MQVIQVADLSDARLTGYRDARDRDLRGRDGLFIVESARCVARLLHSRFPVESLLLSPAKALQLGSALARLGPDVPIFVAEEGLLSAISGYRVHGGALALARRPDPLAQRLEQLLDRVLQEPPITLLAVAGVTHMDNVGSLFRTAAGLGVGGVLLDHRCCDPLLRKAIRVAMGHCLHLPYAWCPDLPTDLRSLSAQQGFQIVAAESESPGGEEGFSAPNFLPIEGEGLSAPPRLVLLLGNEGHGLDRALLECCDARVEIPMRQGVPSLNVAVAGAILLWERVRLSRPS